MTKADKGIDIYPGDILEKITSLKIIISYLLIYIFFLPSAIFVQAQAESDRPELHIPVDCRLGETCFIQNYVDADPTPSYKDYTCGFLSYNDHKGTDFRLSNLAAMETGVRVLAAAPGIVRAVRDGMPDISIKKIDKSLIEGKEAGNSVAIRHRKGWETQYSHLRKGSVVVKSGQKIDTGDVLGLIGLSGNTEFPHLHFSIRHKGKIIDPFTGMNREAGCGHHDTAPLWHGDAMEKLAYLPTGILEAGFTDFFPRARPLHEFIENKNQLTTSVERILFWVHLFGIQEGDQEFLSLSAPDGTILAEKQETFGKNQARYLSIIGKKFSNTPLIPGYYKGTYLLNRIDGKKKINVIQRTYDIRVVKK